MVSAEPAPVHHMYWRVGEMWLRIPAQGWGGTGGKDFVPSKGGWEGLLLNADTF